MVAARCHHRTQAEALTVFDELVYVGPFHWLAAGEDYDTFIKIGNAFQDAFALAGRKIVGFITGSGPATMGAGQRAALCNFKGYDAWLYNLAAVCMSFQYIVLPVEFSRLLAGKNLYDNRLQSTRAEFFTLKGIEKKQDFLLIDHAF